MLTRTETMSAARPMMRIVPSGGILGARVEGLDLAQPLPEAGFGALLRALAEHGVLCFPGQDLTPGQQVAFARRFGSLEVHVSGAFQDPEHPEVMTLSNMTENGRPIGLADAGQDWHTDMSFSRVIAFVNVLHARIVPRRDGRALGETRFAAMTAAHDALPEALRARIAGRTATHDFAKFWDMMRARNPHETARRPLTAAQRAAKPPVSQPMVLTHPLSGRPILYANPGYTVAVDGIDSAASDALLERLFAHQRDPAFQWTHHWAEGDVLVWDNLQTLHYAVPDYGPDEPRLIRRCQAMADRVFDPAFRALAAA